MLDKATFKTAILNILEDMSNREDHPETAREDFATMLSDAIDEYIKTATVTVNTTGTASAQHGTGNIT